MPNNYPKKEEFIGLCHVKREIIETLCGRRLSISTQADLLDSLVDIEKSQAFAEDRPETEIFIRPRGLDLPQDTVREFLHLNPGYKASETTSSNLVVISGEIDTSKL